MFSKNALLFLFVFVVSFAILSIVIIFGPFKNKVVIDEQPLRFSAQALEEEISDVTPFSDLKGGDYGYVGAMYLKKNGIIKGYEDGAFYPEKTMNRAEFIKVISEAAHVYPHALRHSFCYDDVKNDWYAPFVCVAKSQGWVSADATTFNPDRMITLAEVVKIIATISNVEVEEVTDGPWYANVMSAALDMGWFENAGITDLDPEREVTRAEVVNLLVYPIRIGLLK